jgi:hypothetical protein
MIVRDELGGMWKETVVASFKVLFLLSAGETEENLEDFRVAGPRTRFEPGTTRIGVKLVTFLQSSLRFFGSIRVQQRRFQPNVLRAFFR